MYNKHILTTFYVYICIVDIFTELTDNSVLTIKWKLVIWKIETSF